VVLLELVADREIAIGRSVDVPRHRMGTGPMAVGPCADRHRHVEPGAHIESRTAHPRHFQPGPRYFARISGLDSKLPQASTTAPARIATGAPWCSAMTPASRPFSRMRLVAGVSYRIGMPRRSTLA